MIYLIEAEGVGHIKIGFTDHDDALIRLAQLQTGSPVPLRLLGTIAGDELAEKDLHRRFAASKVHNEWFLPVPELLGLLGPLPEPLRNGKTEVTIQQVSIKVLTVGRKQFTAALLKQIPKGELLNWIHVWEFFEQELGAGKSPNELGKFSPKEFYSGNYWGWVKGESGKISGSWSRYLIFERRGVLHKEWCREVPDDDSFPPCCRKIEKSCYSGERLVFQDIPMTTLIFRFWENCCRIWFNLENQLYMGV